MIINEHQTPTVKHARAYIEDGLWYLDLVYQCESDTVLKEIRIPKVRLPIEYAQVDIAYHQDFKDDEQLSIESKLMLPNRYLQIERDRAGLLYTSKIISDQA